MNSINALCSALITIHAIFLFRNKSTQGKTHTKIIKSILLELCEFLWPVLRPFGRVVGSCFAFAILLLLFVFIDGPNALRRYTQRCRKKWNPEGKYPVPRDLKDIDLTDEEEVARYWDLYAPKSWEIVRAKGELKEVEAAGVVKKHHKPFLLAAQLRYGGPRRYQMMTRRSRSISC